MARLALALAALLLLSGCISSDPTQDGGAQPAAESPTNILSAGGQSAPAQPTSAKPTGAPATASATSSDGHPWWTLGVEASAEGTVAAFPWSAPKDARQLEMEDQLIEVVPTIVGNVTAWGLVLAQDLGDGLETRNLVLEAPYTWLTSTIPVERKNGNAVPEFAPFATSGALDDWGTSPDVWLMLAAIGTGHLEIAFRVPGDDGPLVWEAGAEEATRENVLQAFADDGARTALAPNAQAQGVAIDWFRQSGTLTWPGGLGGHLSTAQTAGITVQGSTDLAGPYAAFGTYGLLWSAPWANWSRISWSSHDHLGGRAVIYDLQSGPQAMEGRFVGYGDVGTSVTPHNARALLAGDGPGAQVTMTVSAADTGDWMGFWMNAIAFGASLEDLTGISAKTMRTEPPPVGH